jgi:DNA-directed RNA polymerase specialized sigma24 family protein
MEQKGDTRNVKIPNFLLACRFRGIYNPEAISKLRSRLRKGVETMESPGSVSGWIDRLQAGDKAAVKPLWERYFHLLVQLARKKLQALPRGAADEEDVALSAFDSFCRHAQEGNYPDLHDRNSLWRLLVTITARRASHLRRGAARKKRQGPRHDMPWPWEKSLDLADVERIFSREPDPEFAALMAEECSCLLHGLKDSQLQHVALWRMEGYTVEEIAQKLDLVPRSVKRKLSVIRNLWQRQVEC